MPGWARRAWRARPRACNVFILIILILLAVVLAVILIRTSSTLNDSFKDSKERHAKQEEGTLGVIIKVTLSYLQCLYYIGRLAANWDGQATTFFAVIGQSTLTPNFPAVQCAAQWTFYDRLIFIYISPLIVVAIVAPIYVVRHVVKRMEVKHSRSDCQYALMLLLYQIHPTIMLDVISSAGLQLVWAGFVVGLSFVANLSSAAASPGCKTGSEKRQVSPRVVADDGQRHHRHAPHHGAERRRRSRDACSVIENHLYFFHSPSPSRWRCGWRR